MASEPEAACIRRSVMGARLAAAAFTAAAPPEALRPPPPPLNWVPPQGAWVELDMKVLARPGAHGELVRLDFWLYEEGGEEEDELLGEEAAWAEGAVYYEDEATSPDLP